MSHKLASKISVEIKRELRIRGLNEDLIFVRSILDETDTESVAKGKDLSNITILILHRNSGDLPYVINNGIPSMVRSYLSKYHRYGIFKSDERYGSGSISFSQFLSKHLGDQISRDIDLVDLIG